MIGRGDETILQMNKQCDGQNKQRAVRRSDNVEIRMKHEDDGYDEIFADQPKSSTPTINTSSAWIKRTTKQDNTRRTN